jgi:glycosyltransferase involved in cell wall biosynthesis
LPDERPIRLLLLLGWLNGGGAERVAVQILNGLHGRMLDIRMALVRRAGAYLDLVCPERLQFRTWAERWVPSDGANASFYRPDRFLRSIAIGPLAFRSMIREARPDVVVSFTKGPNVLTYLALRGMGARRPRWMAREGNNIVRSSREDAAMRIGRTVETALVRRAYRAADCVIANSARLALRLHETLGLARERLRVVRNPVDLRAIGGRASERIEGLPARPYVLAAGRLSPQKGHDLLLRAFADSRHRDSHDLVIVGEGPERQALETLAAQLGVAGRVRFPGFVANPWAWMARAELFVLPSRWEGFPNALLEAMACGAPAMAADCCFGPGEMIVHGHSGWLVPPENCAVLRDGIDRLLAAPELRRRLAAEGLRRAAEFRSETILPQFETLFREQSARSRSVGTNPGAARPGQQSEWAWHGGFGPH